MTTRRVTEILGSVSVEGKAYGPFSATADRPYLEVPAGVADVMAWPVHDSDPSLAQADANAGEGTHVDEILKANEDLKADLDKSREKLETLHAAIGWTPDANLSPVDMVRNIWGTAETNREQLTLITDRVRKMESELLDLRGAAKILRAERDAALAQAETQAPAATAPVILPDGLRGEIAALRGVTDQRADEIIALVTAALNPAPAAASEADPQ